MAVPEGQPAAEALAVVPARAADHTPGSDRTDTEAPAAAHSPAEAHFQGMQTARCCRTARVAQTQAAPVALSTGTPPAAHMQAADIQAVPDSHP